MVQSPVPTIILTLAYLLMCYLGPKIMATRRPLEIGSLLVAYNFMMVGISLYLFLEVRRCGYIIMAPLHVATLTVVKRELPRYRAPRVFTQE